MDEERRALAASVARGEGVILARSSEKICTGGCMDERGGGGLFMIRLKKHKQQWMGAQGEPWDEGLQA